MGLEKRAEEEAESLIWPAGWSLTSQLALVSGQHSRLGDQSKPITEVPGIFKAAHGSLTGEENSGKRGQQEAERLAGQERSFTLYHV